MVCGQPTAPPLPASRNSLSTSRTVLSSTFAAPPILSHGTLELVAVEPPARAELGGGACRASGARCFGFRGGVLCGVAFFVTAGGGLQSPVSIASTLVAIVRHASRISAAPIRCRQASSSSVLAATSGSLAAGD